MHRLRGIVHRIERKVIHNDGEADVTHSGEGEGLLFYGNVILPFVDRLPRF